jgi:hypothetical protein
MAEALLPSETTSYNSYSSSSTFSKVHALYYCTSMVKILSKTGAAFRIFNWQNQNVLLLFSW